jgi:hypothetical protein
MICNVSKGKRGGFAAEAGAAQQDAIAPEELVYLAQGVTAEIEPEKEGLLAFRAQDKNATADPSTRSRAANSLRMTDHRDG